MNTILNPELIKAPKPSIEYVIIHELCHWVHRNHTKTFQIIKPGNVRLGEMERETGVFYGLKGRVEVKQYSLLEG